MTRPPVPRLASFLLTGERGEVVLGDLEEAYRARRSQGSTRSGADWWYVRQLLVSTVFVVRETWSTSRPPRTKTTRASAGAHLSSDLAFATRSLWRRPAFTVPVILTLALGIGGSATVFSVVEAVLLRDAPYARPDELVMIWNRHADEADAAYVVNGAAFADVRARVTMLQDVAAIDEVVVAPVLGTEQPSFARLAQASANLFEVLGVEPILGRTFVASDQTPLPSDATERPPSPIVLSHAYWVREFAADPGVLGRSLRTFSNQGVVVGVLPPGFSLLLPAAANVGEDLGAAIDIWGTYRTEYSEWDRQGRSLRLIGRLREGATLGSVRGELDAVASALREEHVVHRDERLALGAEPMISEASRHLRPLLLLLSGAVLCVLLIACVNASGLLLARLVGRGEELEIRRALGAGRFDLSGLVFLESLVLAAGAGFGGLAVAYAGMRLLVWLSPAGLPQADALSINLSLAGFGALSVVVVAVLTGLVPMWRVGSRRGGLNTRAAIGGIGHRRLGEGMVAAQIALTMVLLVAAGLMLRSFIRIQSVPLGFDPDSVLTADISTVGEPPDPTVEGSVAAWVSRRRAKERVLSETLRELPGVHAAGAVFPVPLNGVYERTCTYALEGSDAIEGLAYFRNVWPGYFDAMQIPILWGRDFDYDDDQDIVEWTLDEVEERSDTPRVVIDSRLAEKLWPEENAIGRRLTFATSPSVPHDAEVVGVVPFVPQGAIDDSLETIYIPRSYYRSQELTLMVRVTADDPEVRRSIASAVHDVFPESPVGFVPMESYVERALAPRHFVLTLLGIFAAGALVLASVGLYGTMVLMVRSRTKEFGVHLAMGAPPLAIGRSVVARSLVLAAVGVVSGLCAALALSRFLEAQLFGISAHDPKSLALAAAVQMVVAALAAWGPARRAAAVDPVTTLRHD